MKKDYPNIEDLFKGSFDGYRVEPTASAWKNINGILNLKQLFTPGFKHFNVYYLFAIVGIIAISVFYLNDKNTEPINNTATLINKKEISTEKPDSENKTTATINETIHQKEFKSKARIQQRAENQKSNVVIERSRVEDIIPIAQNYKVEKIADDANDSMTELDKIKVQPPKPLFELNNNKQGCAPFKIKLANYTKLAQKYEWSFGDGGKSKDENPVYTYRYPGVYKITLKATGIGGVAYSVIDSVIVHEGVENIISCSFDSKLTEGELFAVSVRTNQKADYQWSFGDGTYSYKPNSTHKYHKEGQYSISLVTLTENNCYDSVKVADAIIVKSNKKIVFPTAFCPNPNGPSGGKYNSNDLHNTIFHPVVKGQLVEYNLKIFSKTGLLIFESNDVKIGWDGYYQNRLMPSGVYPYVVTIRFEGDTKSVYQRGDITILHSK